MQQRLHMHLRLRAIPKSHLTTIIDGMRVCNLGMRGPGYLGSALMGALLLFFGFPTLASKVAAGFVAGRTSSCSFCCLKCCLQACSCSFTQNQTQNMHSVPSLIQHAYLMVLRP